MTASYQPAVHYAIPGTWYKIPTGTHHMLSCSCSPVFRRDSSAVCSSTAEMHTIYKYRSVVPKTEKKIRRFCPDMFFIRPPGDVVFKKNGFEVTCGRWHGFLILACYRWVTCSTPGNCWTLRGDNNALGLVINITSQHFHSQHERRVVSVFLVLLIKGSSGGIPLQIKLGLEWMYFDERTQFSCVCRVLGIDSKATNPTRCLLLRRRTFEARDHVTASC